MKHEEILDMLISPEIEDRTLGMKMALKTMNYDELIDLAAEVECRDIRPIKSFETVKFKRKTRNLFGMETNKAIELLHHSKYGRIGYIVNKVTLKDPSLMGYFERKRFEKEQNLI